METEVKFRLAGGSNPLILVPAFVNGSGPYEFILDTGAGTSLITPELAERLSMPVREATEAHGVGGKISISLGCVESLTVGDAQAESIQVAVTSELYRIGAAVGAEIHGDVGYDFLHRFQVGIDYRNSVLRLTEGRENVRTVGTSFTLAAPAKPLIQLPVYVNGAGPFHFVLDTGASATVVSPKIADRLGIELKEIPPLRGAGGTVPASKGAVGSLRVGEQEVRNASVVASDFLEMLSGICETELEGVLGYNFLREFQVTIDYPQATLFLEQ